MALLVVKIAAVVIAFGTVCVGLYNYLQSQWATQVEVDLWPLGKLSIRPAENYQQQKAPADHNFEDQYYLRSRDNREHENIFSREDALERFFLTIYIMGFAGSVISLLVTYNNEKNRIRFSTQIVRWADIGFHVIFAIFLLITAFVRIVFSAGSLQQDNSYGSDGYDAEDQESDFYQHNALISTVFAIAQAVLYGIILIFLAKQHAEQAKNQRSPNVVAPLIV